MTSDLYILSSGHFNYLMLSFPDRLQMCHRCIILPVIGDEFVMNVPHARLRLWNNPLKKTGFPEIQRQWDLSAIS